MEYVLQEAGLLGCVIFVKPRRNRSLEVLRMQFMLGKAMTLAGPGLALGAAARSARAAWLSLRHSLVHNI